jgi:transcription elongation factor S-II
MDLPIPEGSTRKRGYEMLKNVFDKHVDGLSEEDRTKLAINVERGIFNSCVSKKDYKTMYWNSQFRDQYSSHFLHIYHNLNPDSHVKNPHLLKRLVTGDFTIDYLCKQMSAEEMFPEMYYEYHHEQDEELRKIEAQKELLNTTTGLFRCGKCKQNKTTYYQLQIRSADEGLTTFVTCVNCNNRWRFN